MLRLLLCFLFLITTPDTSAGDCETPLVLSYNGDWEPYFYMYGQGQYDGVDYKLLSDVITAMGCTLAVLPMTEARSHIELRKGSYDVSIGASYTKSRQQDFHFSVAYRDEQVGFVLAAEDGHSSGTLLSDILDAGGVVGLNMSGYFGPVVDRLKAQFGEQFVHGFSLSERLRLLTLGEVDAIVDDRLALCTELHKMPSFAQSGDSLDLQITPRLILADQVLHRDDIHFMFSKQTIATDFVRRFNTHVAEHQQQQTMPDCPTKL